MAEDAAGGFVFGHFVADFAKGFFGCTDGIYHCLEFVRLKREGAIMTGMARERVKCFSMMQALSATAATGTAIPSV